MRPFAFFVVALIGITQAFAQNGYGSTSIYDRTTNLPAGKHFFILPPNAYWNKQAWKDSIYLFPQFQTGKLEMTTGFVPSHRPMMNYNVFLEFIEIKADDGEIFPLKQSSDVKIVWIGDHKMTYAVPFGYMEVILEGKALIGERTVMRAIYELSSGVKYPLSTTDVRTAISKSTRYYWSEKRYYILDDKGHVYRPTYKVLQKIFPKKKKEIRSFVKSHRTDFKKREDLLEVTTYCNQQL